MPLPVPFLSLENITLRLGDDAVFAQTNWTVNSDEQWAIIGPNGSGKSTLMRAICGRVPVITGTITYHFKDHTSTQPETQIAYVAFDASDNFDDGQNFYQARWNSGVGEPGTSVADILSEQRIWQRNPFEVAEPRYIAQNFQNLSEYVIQQLDIANLLTKKYHQLSNGERRKVSIARALLRQPKLLILDNVFEGLDPQYRQHLGKVLNTLLQSSMRVFLVTSDAADLPSSFDHILGINNHSVIAQGPRDAVLASLSQQSSQNKPADAPKTLIHPPSDREKASDIVIQMRNVTITYNGTHILRGVNWQVARGDRWALLGHNGAGKTTLLSLIMGDNPQAYANEIELFGMRRGSGESIWEIKRRIGWMAPELHRYYPPVYKCFDVVCSGWFDSIGLYRKCNESQSNAVYAVMDDLNIGKLAQQQFRHVSETEQRLVLLARALVKHPQLLILDEPSQGLDRRNRQLVYQVLDKTTHWADSLILVTHQTHDLPQCITHILTLRKGQSISQRARHSESQ